MAAIIAIAATTGSAAWAAITQQLVACATTTACLGGANTGIGPGVLGAAVGGAGVEGAGSKTALGVSSTTTAAVGVHGVSLSGIGVKGTSVSGDGVFATTSSVAASAILARAEGKKAAYAISGVSTLGTGVTGSGLTAFKGTASASCPITTCLYGVGASYRSIAAVNVQPSSVAQSPIVLRNAKNQIVFSVDEHGDVFFAGKLVCPVAYNEVINYKTGAIYYECVAAQGMGPLGRPRAVAPAEFAGEALLTRGAASVVLPDDFRNRADTAHPYDVYLTPLADSTGALRVERETPRGFAVRASGPESGPVAFAYRVVAAKVAANVAPPAGALPARAEPIPAPATASVALPAVAKTPAPRTSCALKTYCSEGSNTGKGPGLEGTSATGFGVEGTASGAAGIGVLGSAAAATGVTGSSTNAYGVEAASSTGTALTGTTSSKTLAGVSGEATAPGGTAVSAISNEGTGILGSGVTSFSGTGTVSIRGTNGAPLLIVTGRSEDQFSVDDLGVLAFSGVWICPAAFNASATTCNAEDSSTAATSIHFTGDAQLRHGVATVGLDPAFARQIDRTRPYRVSLTPDGDSSGWLYVDSRTPDSFTVREHGGGRSSISFEYEIEADVPVAQRRLGN
jgi:hypothetical protein